MVMWPCTVPSLRCRNAPNVLKIAPWKMSVPTAVVGLKPKRMIRIGVISEPPPTPVRPTIRPRPRPVSVSCQVIGPAPGLVGGFPGRDARSRAGGRWTGPGGSPAREHHPGADGLVRRLVDQDEGTGRPVLLVRIDAQRLGEPEVYD